MRRTGLLLASTVVALLLASGITLLDALKPAQAAFPDSNGAIAFVSDRSGSSEIYRMKPDGTQQKRLMDPEPPSSEPS
jgi:hypothetical protein